MRADRSRPFVTLAVIAMLGAALACSDDDDPIAPPTPPGAPSNLDAAAIAATKASLTFTGVSEATSYIVQRATGAGAFVAVDTIAATTFEDTGLQASTNYRYRVVSMTGQTPGELSSEVEITTAPTGVVGAATLTGNITSNRRLRADTLYVLSGFVKVLDGATLTIDAGTRIVGDLKVPGSALFVTRGARIEANGAAAQPIVFTSRRAVGSRKPGDWGGLLIIGRASVNRTGTTILEGSNATINGVPQTGIDYAGGTLDADNSGTLRYVRVEFAGFGVAPNAELNSFTFAAVGSGTTLEYLQSMAGLDDSFEWFGGTVDAKYLVSYESGDDHFDAAEGYRGRNQFMIAMQSTQLPPLSGTGQLASDPQGFEIDGCGSSTGCPAPAGASQQSATPYTMPVFANFTMIGTGGLTTSGDNGGHGAVIRVGTGGTFINGVIARWPRSGISVRDTTTFNRESVDSLIVSHLVLAENTAANFHTSTAGFTATDVRTRLDASTMTEHGGTAASLFIALPAIGAAPTTGTIDWTPAAASPAASGGMAAFTGHIAARAGTFVTPTAYRGAADPAGTNKWWTGWTVYTRS